MICKFICKNTFKIIYKSTYKIIYNNTFIITFISTQFICLIRCCIINLNSNLTITSNMIIIMSSKRSVLGLLYKNADFNPPLKTYCMPPLILDETHIYF